MLSIVPKLCTIVQCVFLFPTGWHYSALMAIAVDFIAFGGQ
jgi:hypothetical protein